MADIEYIVIDSDSGSDSISACDVVMPAPLTNEQLATDENSSDSIVEVEKPPKPIPPLVEIIDDAELVLNVNSTQKIAHVANHVSKTITVNEPDPSSDLLSPNHWTPAMRKFYNWSWGDEETFQVNLLKKKMSKDPNLWKVSPKDLVQGFKGERCRLCGGRGHLAARCDNRLKSAMCHMCGGVGHYFDRCPKAICLSCGASKQEYLTACKDCIRGKQVTCERCSLNGHSTNECTDHWRRFHDTISGEVKIPEGLAKGEVNKPWAELWCCNCGRKGHDSYYCREHNASQFPVKFPFVVFYEKEMPEESKIRQTTPWTPQRPYRYFNSSLIASEPRTTLLTNRERFDTLPDYCMLPQDLTPQRGAWNNRNNRQSFLNTSLFNVPFPAGYQSPHRNGFLTPNMPESRLMNISMTPISGSKKKKKRPGYKNKRARNLNNEFSNGNFQDLDRNGANSGGNNFVRSNKKGLKNPKNFARRNWKSKNQKNKADLVRVSI